MSNNTGGPAFPLDYEHTKVLVQMQEIGDISAEQLIKLSRQLSGMTLRDYFAAKAMQGLLAQSQGTALGSTVETAAEYAYAMADAMLKERDK